MPTITAALTEAVNRLQTSTDSPLLDAEILLCLALEQSRSYLRAWPERKLTQTQHRYFFELIAQREHGLPVAYLTGVREFWSREFKVTPDVLIPRPETELLVEISLELIPPGQPCQILDLGTGSGIIAITLAAERPQGHVMATDLSPTALLIATENAKRHQVSNVSFIQSDWFAKIPSNQFDLIVSNPPYIAENDVHLSEGDLRYEPVTALIAGEDGLHDIKHIAINAREQLKKNAYLALEHGYNQKHEVQAIFRDCGFRNIKTLADLSKQPRVTYGQYQP